MDTERNPKSSKEAKFLFSQEAKIRLFKAQILQLLIVADCKIYIKGHKCNTYKTPK